MMAFGLYLFLTGKLHSDQEFSKVETDNASLRAANEKLTEALSLERQRSNDATQAGAVTVQLIGALTTLATEHRAESKAEHQDAADKADARALAVPLDLTGKDIGL